MISKISDDMETIVNAGGAKPERLLTWKERKRNDNIELDAGKFSILTQEEATEFGRPQEFSFMSFFKHEYLSRSTDQESAKRFCEQHARTLLGWDDAYEALAKLDDTRAVPTVES